MDLKPCPFCGKKVSFISVENEFGLSPYMWIVKCDECGCQTAKHISDHDAINAWNKRYETDKKIVCCKDCAFGVEAHDGLDRWRCTAPGASEFSHAGDFFCADGAKQRIYEKDLF